MAALFFARGRDLLSAHSHSTAACALLSILGPQGAVVRDSQAGRAEPGAAHLLVVSPQRPHRVSAGMVVAATVGPLVRLDARQAELKVHVAAFRAEIRNGASA